MASLVVLTTSESANISLHTILFLEEQIKVRKSKKQNSPIHSAALEAASPSVLSPASQAVQELSPGELPYRPTSHGSHLVAA